MPVEFLCDKCGRMLRVADESTGNLARCPGCGKIQTVPRAVGPGSEKPGDSAGKPGEFAGKSPNPFAEAPTENPYSAPAAAPFTPFAPPQMTRELARSRIMGPAIGMIVIGILGAGIIGLLMLGGLVSLVEDGANSEDSVGLLICAGMMVMQLVVLVGAIRMLTLRNYGLAMTASIMSMICGLGFCVALPFGIWALVVLSDSNVKAHFS